MASKKSSKTSTSRSSSLRNALKKVLTKSGSKKAVSKKTAAKKKTVSKKTVKKATKKKTVKKAVAKKKVAKKAVKKVAKKAVKKTVSKKKVTKKVVKTPATKKRVSKASQTKKFLDNIPDEETPAPKRSKVLMSNGVKLTPTLIHSIIAEVSGEDNIDLYKALKGKENISEFVLAEAIDREINVTRNMLYRLYHANLVSFIRKKDKQKGWYIYYWTFNPLQLAHLFQTLRKDRLEKLQERINREQNSHFYQCPENCMRLDFERATEYSYKCPECGQIMDMADNSAIVASLMNQLDTLQKTPARFK